MMIKKLIQAVTLAFTLAFIQMPPFIADANAASPSPEKIRIHGGRAGMASYVAAIALADLINANSSRLKAVAVESPNLTVNFRLLEKEPERRADTLIISMRQFAYLSKNAIPPFTRGYDGLRFIAALGYNFMSFVTLDPTIKTVTDFAGKRVSIGDKSSLTRVKMYQSILRSAGVLDRVRLEYLDLKSGGDALRDGLVDATIGTVNMVSLPDRYSPSPYLAELISTRKVYFVSIGGAHIARMNSELGPIETEHRLPAGSLGPTQQQAWTGLGKAFSWAADQSMPETVVYEICRIIYENAAQFKDYSPSLGFISGDSMPKMGVTEAEVHPGALRFYQENDLTIDNFQSTAGE